MRLFLGGKKVKGILYIKPEFDDDDVYHYSITEYYEPFGYIITIVNDQNKSFQEIIT